MAKLKNKIMFVEDVSGIGLSGIHGDHVGEIKVISKSVLTTMGQKNFHLELVYLTNTQHGQQMTKMI